VTLRGSDPDHPLAQYRPDRRAARPLLGRVPDPGLAHGSRGWKLWDALASVWRPTGCSTSTTSSSSIPPCPWLPDDQRAGGGRYPAGAAWGVFPGIRLHGALLRHAARDLRLDRGGREHGRPRPGPPRLRFEWDAVRAVLTRYDARQQAEMAALMQAYMGGSLSPPAGFHRADRAGGRTGAGIYEADYRDFNRETYARGLPR
jgi:chromosome partitioning protein